MAARLQLRDLSCCFMIFRPSTWSAHASNSVVLGRGGVSGRLWRTGKCIPPSHHNRLSPRLHGTSWSLKTSASLLFLPYFSQNFSPAPLPLKISKCVHVWVWTQTCLYVSINKSTCYYMEVSLVVCIFLYQNEITGCFPKSADWQTLEWQAS